MAKSDKKVEELQDELKVLKNEIKETLVDIREHLLTYSENPFVTALTPSTPGAPPVEANLPPHQPIGPSVEPASAANLLANPSASDDPPEPKVDVANEADGELDEEFEDDTEKLLDEAVDEPEHDEPLKEAAGPPSPPPEAEAAAAAVSRRNGPSEPEVNEAPGPPPAWAADASRQRPPAPAGSDQSADLLTVAMLSNWMEEHLRRIGTDKMKEIVEIYASMGGVPQRLQGVLLRLLSLDQRPAPIGKQVTLKDYLRVLAELDSLLWRSRHDRAGAALMSVLLANNNNGGLFK